MVSSSNITRAQRLQRLGDISADLGLRLHSMKPWQRGLSWRPHRFLNLLWWEGGRLVLDPTVKVKFVECVPQVGPASCSGMVRHWII